MHPRPPPPPPPPSPPAPPARHAPTVPSPSRSLSGTTTTAHNAGASRTVHPAPLTSSSSLDTFSGAQYHHPILGPLNHLEESRPASPSIEPNSLMGLLAKSAFIHDGPPSGVIRSNEKRPRNGFASPSQAFDVGCGPLAEQPSPSEGKSNWPDRSARSNERSEWTDDRTAAHNAGTQPITPLPATRLTRSLSNASHTSVGTPNFIPQLPAMPLGHDKTPDRATQFSVDSRPIEPALSSRQEQQRREYEAYFAAQRERGGIAKAAPAKNAIAVSETRSTSFDAGPSSSTLAPRNFNLLLSSTSPLQRSSSLTERGERGKWRSFGRSKSKFM
ncbi:hypothetical protein DFJ73DRAFT_834071 [Zopfochytrium polystomum]|nr:hypothetical protein DFJ73DRAFT_834071 [Zopfochytrium polystomum]